MQSWLIGRSSWVSRWKCRWSFCEDVAIIIVQLLARFLVDAAWLDLLAALGSKVNTDTGTV
jgi:hypothetical protein